MKNWGLILLILATATFLRLWMLNGGDVTDDEKHYIIDAQRLLNKDPYISIRHHAYKHPQPSIGHPFLYQISQAEIFKYFGLSVYASRLLNALSGIAIVAVLLFFSKQLGGKVSILAAFFVAILPLSVRFSRNAQLDTFFALWTTLTALSIWRYFTDGKKYWLLICGLSVGFTISTKLNGVYIIPMVLLLLTFARKERLSLKLIKRLFIDLVWVFAPAVIISYIFNDPRSYIDGIVHPSFEAYSFFSKEFILQRLPFLFSPASFIVFFKVNFILLSPVFLGASILSVYFFLKKEKGLVRRFLFLWILPFLNLFIIHGLRMDGAYGWIPLIPPLVLSVSFWINTLDKKTARVVIFSTVVCLLPFLFFYGLSFLPLPFKDFPMNHNRTINQNFYQGIISKVNKITPSKGKVFFLPQTYYPLYALRPDISWSYSNTELNSYDVYVVESESLIDAVKDKIEQVETFYGYDDGKNLKRSIFVKK